MCAELLEQMNLAGTFVNQIRTPLFFNKKSTGSCHRDNDYATKPVSSEENGFIAPQNGSLSLCPSFTPRSLKTLQLPHLNTIAPGGKWQVSLGDNFKIATVSSVAVCIDIVLFIMIPSEAA